MLTPGRHDLKSAPGWYIISEEGGLHAAYDDKDRHSGTYTTFSEALVRTMKQYGQEQALKRG